MEGQFHPPGVHVFPFAKLAHIPFRNNNRCGQLGGQLLVFHWTDRGENLYLQKELWNKDSSVALLLQNDWGIFPRHP